MSVRESGIAKNSVSLISVLSVIGVYLFMGSLAYTEGGGEVFILVLIIALVSVVLTIGICRNEIKSLESGNLRFKKSNPFSRFGIHFGDFQHIYHSDSDLSEDISDKVDEALANRTPLKGLREVEIEDRDPDISPKESRAFLVADEAKTARGTDVALILLITSFGEIRSVRWWVTVGGYVSRNRYFNFVAYSPAIIWFWVIPYLRRNFDILPWLRNIYTSSYNDMDIVTLVRSLHETVFVALLDTLEAEGIDTSELRVQRSQVMNINVSGGKVSIGNVVQGAMNKVSSKVGVAR